METILNNEPLFKDENDKLIFKILAEILKKHVDHVLEANCAEVKNEQNSRNLLYSFILKTNEKNELDQFEFNNDDLAIDEAELTAKVENTNTILSRIVLNVIEESSNSIENLRYLKNKCLPKNNSDKVGQEVTQIDITNETTLTKSTSKMSGLLVKKQRAEKCFKCIVCSKKYTTKDKLRQHLLKKHLSHSKFTCTRCNKNFPLKSQLKNHLKSPCKPPRIKLNDKVIIETNLASSFIDTTPKSIPTNEEIIDLNYNDSQKDQNSPIVENNQRKIYFNPMEFMKCNYKKRIN